MTETVLFVDIDRQLVRALGRAFDRAGYQPLEAHDGEQAIEAVTNEEPSLVVLDVTLPKRDGFAVLETIRDMAGPVAKTPVLLTCVGRVTPQYEERASRLGAQGILGKPVPVKQLLAHAEKLLGRAAVPDTTKKKSKKSSASCSEDRAFEGNIADMRLPHSLQRLLEMRATGVLMVSTAKKKKAIELHEGQPVAVKSNLVTECLGPYLVREGLLSEEEVAESIERKKKHGGLQGEILVAMEVITPEEIERALKAQAEAKLFEMFAWRRGEFRLKRGRLARANPLAFEGSPVNVILEGVRKRTSREDIEAFLDLHAAKQVKLSPTSIHHIDDVDLTGEERALVEEIDGAAKLSDLAGTDPDLHRLLYGLLATGVLELPGEPEEALAKVAHARSASASTPGSRGLRIELAAMAERMRGKTHFQILGVREDAGVAELERAYQNLTTKTRAERFVGADKSVQVLAEDLLGQVSTAYEVLADEDARNDYVTEMNADDAGNPTGGDGKQATRSATDERFARAQEAFRMGESLLDQKRYEHALREFGAARKASGQNADYLAYYAWCLHRCNPNNATVTEEALAHLRQAVKLARNQEKPYLLLARLHKVLGQNFDAENYFERAAQINPDCVEAVRELRLIRMRQGKTGRLLGKLIRR